MQRYEKKLKPNQKSYFFLPWYSTKDESGKIHPNNGLISPVQIADGEENAITFAT